MWSFSIVINDHCLPCISSIKCGNKYGLVCHIAVLFHQKQTYSHAASPNGSATTLVYGNIKILQKFGRYHSPSPPVMLLSTVAQLAPSWNSRNCSAWDIVYVVVDVNACEVCRRSRQQTGDMMTPANRTGLATSMMTPLITPKFDPRWLSNLSRTHYSAISSFIISDLTWRSWINITCCLCVSGAIS